MENKNICIFCGEPLSPFRVLWFNIADTQQTCCKQCLNEIKNLSKEEQCRRALRLGYALQPDKLEEQINLITQAEEHRPSCQRCGGKMKFEPVQYFDNTPGRDSIFSEGFEVLPAYCESCGKYEFYKPSIANKNRFVAYLMEKDTTK